MGIEHRIKDETKEDPYCSSSQITDGRITTPTLTRRAPSMSRDSVARDARDSIYAAASRPVYHRDLSAHLPFGSYAEQGMHTKAPSRYMSSSYSTGGHTSRSRGVTPGLNAKPPAPTYPSAASSGRRNSISISSSTNMASMSSNTSSGMAATSSRRRHVSMSSTASYGTPAASRGIPFY